MLDSELNFEYYPNTNPSKVDKAIDFSVNFQKYPLDSLC